MLLCLVPFFGYLTLNNVVTLKFVLEVTQDHLNWDHSIALVQIHINAFPSNYGSIVQHFGDICRKSSFFHTPLH